MAGRGQNPYAAPQGRAGEAPNSAGEFQWQGYSRYAVPDIPESTDPEWTTGYSPALRVAGSPDGSALPDDIRVGHREPPPNDPNQHPYNERRYSEFHKRHAVEEYSEGWKVQQARIPGPRMPLWEQERAPTRPTANQSPTNYAFCRPWHVPRNAADALGPQAVLHFSLADHRRTYEVWGMKPQGRVGANTYRASPRPWDEALFVPPPVADRATPNGVPGNRSYRL